MATLPYRVVKLTSRINGEEKQMFKAKIQRTGVVTLRELSEKIAFSCTLTPMDIAGVMEAMLYVVTEELNQGKIVYLGDFGSLRIDLFSKAQALEEEVTGETIKGTRLRFRPHKATRVKMLAVDFAKAKPKD